MKKTLFISVLFLIVSVPAFSKGCSLFRKWSSTSSPTQQTINWGDTIYIPYGDTTFHVQVYFYNCQGPTPPTVVLMIKDPQGVMHNNAAGHYDFTEPGEYNIYEFEDQPANRKILFYVAFMPAPTSTSIPENTPNTISIYPNPFADQLTIAMNNGNTEQLRVRIFSVDGRLAIEHYYTDISSCTLVTFALPPGIYIAEIRTKDTTIKQKILKTGS